jgi:hypothetical protein
MTTITITRNKNYNLTLLLLLGAKENDDGLLLLLSHETKIIVEYN